MDNHGQPMPWAYSRTRDMIAVRLVVLCRAPLPASKVACKQLTRVRPRRTRRGEQPCRAPLTVSQMQGGQQPPDPGQAWSPRVVSKPGWPGSPPRLHCSLPGRALGQAGRAVQASRQQRGVTLHAPTHPPDPRLTRAPKKLYAAYYNKA